MGSSSSAGRSQVTIVNGTRRAVWVALYKRSLLRTHEPPVAWQVVSPPPRGRTAVFIPREYQVYARYSFEPEDPRRPIYQTNALPVLHAPAGAGFVIEGVSPDRRTWAAVLARAAGRTGLYELRVANRFPIGVWSHVRQDGRDVFPPRVLPPASTGIEDLSSPFCVAVLALPRAAGDLLLETEIVSAELPVKVGDSVKIQGGPRKGFEIVPFPLKSKGLTEKGDENAIHNQRNSRLSTGGGGQQHRRKPSDESNDLHDFQHQPLPQR